MTSMGTGKMNKPTIGVDVSKDYLDAARWPDGETRRVTNDAKGRYPYRELFRLLRGAGYDDYLTSEVSVRNMPEGQGIADTAGRIEQIMAMA